MRFLHSARLTLLLALVNEYLELSVSRQKKPHMQCSCNYWIFGPLESIKHAVDRVCDASSFLGHQCCDEAASS